MEIAKNKIIRGDNNRTELVFIADRSGSMNSIRDDVIGGLNVFIEEQQKAKGEATITYCQFDTEYEIVHKSISIHDMPKFDRSNYVPRGGTALLDALGRTINDLESRLLEMNEIDRPSKIVVVIITDGQENASKEFSCRGKIMEMIKHHQEINEWQFIYLAADDAAFADGRDFGFEAANSVRFAKGAVGTSNILRGTSAKLASYRSTGNIDELTYSDKDREEALEGGDI